MKTTVLFLTVTLVFSAGLVNGTAQKGIKNGKTSLSGSPAAVLYGNGGNKLNMMTVAGNPGLLYDKAEKIVTLPSPSTFINPWKSLHRGKFYVVHDNKDNKAVQYGHGKWTVIDKFKVFVFKREGAGEKYIGADLDSNIWTQDDSGKITKIGRMKWKMVNTPDGKKNRALMTRTVNPEGLWTCCLGNGIFQEQKEGTLKQIGWLEWRVITQENGKNAAIIMTKGMGKNDKWQGRFKGILYRDK